MSPTPTRPQRVESVIKLAVSLGLVAVIMSLISGVTASNGAASDTQAANDRLEGEFLVSGSSTVFPIVQLQAEQFIDIAPGLAIAVEGPGSGDGAKKFCSGEAPIANASRTFKDEEIAICEQNGIELIELKRGIDGISVITSPDNDIHSCLSFNDLYAVLSEEAAQTTSWSEANSLTANWSGTQFDDVELAVFGPGEESGTFDSFAEIVIESVAKGKTGLDPGSRQFVKSIRPDYTSNPDDNVIIEGIQASRYSLGWVGFAYAQQAAEAGRAQLLAVSKQDGGPCVKPTAETIASAEFPIARFLYTYVNADAAANQPGVAEFVDYMLSDDGLSAVTASGYIMLPEAELAAVKSNWDDRVTGRRS